MNPRLTHLYILFPNQLNHNSNLHSQGCLDSMYAEQRDHQYASFGATYLKYRKVVAEWMVDVCEYFTLHQTTTHAAISYLDRLQPHEKFSRFEWQMIAISCILIASKYNECEDHVPDLATLEDITQQAITNETVLQYELWALKRMGWKLNARAPICFLCSFMVKGLIFDSDVLLGSNTTLSMREAGPGAMRQVESQAEELARKYAGHCILDATFKSFIASDVACAIVFCARQQVGCREPWDAKLITHTGLRENPHESQEVRDIIHLLSEADLTTNASSILLPPRHGRGAEQSHEALRSLVNEDEAHDMTVMRDPSPSNKENLHPEINVSVK
jgi:hypothetical protein